MIGPILPGENLAAIRSIPSHPPTLASSMSRLTRSQLDDRASRAAAAIGLPLADLWLQRSETGYGIFRTFGAGAQALAECLTAAEADQFLRGLEVGAVLTRQTIRPL